MGGNRIEKLYTDASFCDGKSGMAVVAPSWAANLGGWWRSNWDVHTAHVPERNAVVFYASCRCQDINDAEKRAIGMAFLLADDMMSMVPGLRVEILSDSLNILDRIMRGNAADMWDDPILGSLYRKWNERTIILTKVRAHNGHWGNELADAWAKRARRELADRVPYQGQGQRRQPPYQPQYQGPYQGQQDHYQPQYQGPYQGQQDHYQPPYPPQYQGPYQGQQDHYQAPHLAPYRGRYQDTFRR